ncbi:MAG: nuclear transport factor 2 family protein [Acidobacteriota bacterium]
MTQNQTQNVAELDHALNQMILNGQILEAFDRYYGEDVVMAEPAGIHTGKEVNRKREEEFVGSVAQFHGAEVSAHAAGEDVTFSEWSMDITFQDGTRKTLEQVAVRRWRGGLVVHERFYYDTAG